MSERVVNLTTSKELDQAVAQSFDRPVLIYKHSSMCSVSSGAHQVIHQLADTENLPGNLFFTQVGVIENRDVSDEVESRFGIRHESPQVLLLTDGQVTWNTSHFNITAEAIKAASDKVNS